MFNFFLKSAEYDIRTILNMALYYFRKIPVLNWLAPGSSYKNESLKKTLVFLSPLAILIFSVFRSLFNIGILALFALWGKLIISIFKEMAYRDVFLNLALVVSILEFSKCFFINNKDKSLIYYNLFKVDPRTIFIANHFINLPIKTLASFLALALVGRLAGFSLNLALSLAFLSYLASSIYNYINARLLARKVLSESRLTKLGFLAVLLMLVAFTAMVFFNISAEFLLENFYFKLGMLVLGLLSLIGLMKFSDYSIILNDLSQDYQNITTYNDKKKEAIAKANKLKVEDFEASKAHLNKNLSGYKLLNELFFQRHRRHILKPIIMKASILAVIVLILIVLPFIPIKGLQEEIPADYGSLLVKRLTGILPFVSYLLFVNESIIRTMFANCDHALMQYGFYRRPKDLLKMFFLRLQKLVFWNSLVLLPGLVFLILMNKVHLAGLEDCIILGVQFLALWVFFSVHTLFLYYIFQPYNDAQEAKSPIYFIINLAVYYVCYFTMQLGLEGPLIAPIFIGASLVYSILALVLVYKLAPKTFKVKIERS